MSRRAAARFPAFVLAIACLLAALSGLMPGAMAQGQAAPAASASAASVNAGTTGHAPTPAGVLPPGAFYPDSGPSKVVYPPQKITLRFDHQKHTSKDIGLACTDCHAGGATSVKAEDRMMPPPTMCDGCHTSNHTDLTKVVAGPDGFGTCDVCHAGWKAADGNVVARLELPTPHLRSNHKVHADRKINCEQCHGAVQQVTVATVEQMPRMKGCFGCHAMSGPGQGKAKNDCNVCHEVVPDGRIQSKFVEGPLLPPRWMGGLEHTADFIERHKRVAADNSAACASCHKEDFCTDCHDGKVRPRSIHPNDFISMHSTEARLETQRCESCHQQQTFCMPCHQRAGVTQTGSAGNLHAQGRFHPPARIWSDPPKSPQHHSWEAQRNLNACVSCHTERDCATCHAAKGVGGQGFNPHPAGFLSKCGSAMRKNPRPCLVCHEQADIQACR